MSGFSINKAPPFFLLRLPSWCYSAASDGSQSLSVKLLRWRCGGWVSIDEASYNKRDLLRRCGFLLLMLSLLASHGGGARDWPPATTCSDGGVGASLATMSSSTTEATQPLRLPVGKAMISKPPMRRPFISDAGARCSPAMK
jgi:hypothetical protein